MVLGLAVPAWAQTYQFPRPVEIKPPTAARTADALRIWGGLKAGPTGSTTVINADGTLNMTSSLPPCTTGQILKWDGDSWECAADAGTSGVIGAFDDGDAGAPGITFDLDGDTGFFRPTDNTVALSTGGTERWRVMSTGNLTSAGGSGSQLLHLYTAAGQGGLRIERGDSATWDILGSANLTISHVEAAKTALTIQATTGYVGIGMSPTVALDVSGAARVSTNLTVGGYIAENSLIPQYPDSLDLGSAARPWANIHASVLNATIFAEATAQLFGGYSIVGFNAGTFDATVDTATTQIDFDKAPHATLSLPVWIIVRAHNGLTGQPATEYMRVTSVVNGTTHIYAVERDITGLHATDPQWPAGTSYLVLGTLGTGRLEMNAYQGVPTLQVLMQEQSASAPFNDATNDPRHQVGVVWLGGLDGIPVSGSTGRYGIFIGRTDAQYLMYRQTFGTPGVDDNTLVVKGTVRALAGYFGSDSAVTIDASGLQVGNTGRVAGGATDYATGTGFWLGYDGGQYKLRIGTPASNRLTWDGSALTIVGNVTITNTIPNTSITGLGSLSTANSVDLATGQVTNKSLANLDSAANIKLNGIEAGATVGAAWGSNLTGRPVELTDGRITTALNDQGTVLTKAAPTVAVGTPATQGLYLGSDVLGFYKTGTGAGWKTYMDNLGRFYLSGTGSQGLAWDGTNLTINGSITLTTPIPHTGVSGLGSLATANSVDLATGQVTNKSLANVDSAASTKLSGIAAGATVGAAWGSNLTGIPGTLGAPTGTGLFLASTHMGFYTGGAWTSYIKSDGYFRFYKDADEYIEYTGGTLTIRGSLTADDITAGNLTGRIVQTTNNCGTSANVACARMTTSGLFTYNSSNAQNIELSQANGLVFAAASGDSDSPRRISFSSPTTWYGSWGSEHKILVEGSIRIGEQSSTTYTSTASKVFLSSDNGSTTAGLTGNVTLALDATNSTTSLRLFETDSGSNVNANFGAAGYYNYNGWTAAAGTPLTDCSGYICKAPSVIASGTCSSVTVTNGLVTGCTP